MGKNPKQTAKMSREQKLEHQKNLELPINKFLNATDKEGKLKYEIAPEMRTYFISNPDPILNEMRMCNSLLHELRWRKSNAKKYFMDYELDSQITSRDKYGQIMSKEECYLAYISENQNVHIVLSKLRQTLTEKLLSKCDGDVFTLDQYNEYVLMVKQVVEEMGYILFPSKVELIKPQ